MEIMSNRKGFLAVLLLFSAALSLPAAAASTKAEVTELEEEVAALKEAQKEIQSELAEIRKLLEAGARPAAAQRPVGPPFEPTDLVVGESATVGSNVAAVTMFAYSDYQCPYCQRHATTVMPQVVEQYVDSGKLRIVMREYPIEAIHPRAFAAAQSAVCAGKQGKYWEMHDAIFANQRALSEDDLKTHAGNLELDAAAFEACMADKEVENRIRSEIKEAQGMGINGTPSFVAGVTDLEDPNQVNVTQYIRGAQQFDRFKSVVDQLLEEAESSD